MMARDISHILDPTILALDVGIVCDDWQANLLRLMPKRALLCCARQTGKTLTTALMALHRALYEPGSLTVVVESIATSKRRNVTNDSAAAWQAAQRPSAWR